MHDDFCLFIYLFYFIFFCNAIAQKLLQQSNPKFQGMFISPRVFVDKFLVNLGIQVRGVWGWESTPQEFNYIQNTSDVGEMWTIYVDLQ